MFQSALFGLVDVDLIVVRRQRSQLIPAIVQSENILAVDAVGTHSLREKPEILQFPPIRPMLAQNMPCRSSGKSAMLAATVALSPVCSSPGDESIGLSSAKVQVFTALE